MARSDRTCSHEIRLFLDGFVIPDEDRGPDEVVSTADARRYAAKRARR